MNLKEIREECWAFARETGASEEERLWGIKEMNRYVNRVYRRIARETRCIRDADTLPLCQIASNPVDWTTLRVGTLDYQWANDPESWLYQRNVAPYLYTLDPRIIEVCEVKWTKRPWKLTKVSCVKWQINPWWEQIVGMPTEYCTDLASGKIALNFRSETADTLRLTVKRLPLKELSLDSDIPEIKSQYHDFFLYGVLEQMYGKQDVETIDKQKGNEYGVRFLMDLDRIKRQEEELDKKLNVSHSQDAFR